MTETETQTKTETETETETPGASRPSRRARLLRGLPALCVACAAGVLVVMAVRARNLDPAEVQEKLQRAIEAEDWREADIWLSRLMERRPNAELLLQHALIQERLERSITSEELLAALAPDGRQGYWRAHLKRAKDQLARRPLLRSNLQAAEQHLRRSFSPISAGHVHALLGAVLLDLGQVEAGGEQLRKGLAQKLPDIDVTLVAYSNWLTRVPPDHPQIARIRTEAQAVADRFLSVAGGRLQQDDTPDLLIKTALALRIQGKIEVALETLKKGLEKHPKSTDLARAASQVCLQQARTAGLRTPEGAQKIREAVEICRKDGEVLVEILRVEETKDGVLAYLDTFVDEPGEEALNFYVGSALLMLDQPDDAWPYLEAAVLKLPGVPATVNNLALCLVRKKEPDHARAVDLVEKAMERHPDSTMLRNTYGEVLSHTSEHRKALEILEATMSEQVGHALATTLEAMARCYRGLGQTGLEEKFRARSQTVREKARKETSRRLWGVGLVE